MTEAGAVFVIERRATGLTLVLTVEALFAGFVSVTPAGVSARAVLMMVALAVPLTYPLMTIVTLEPAGITPIVAVTALPETEKPTGQVAPLDEALQLAETPDKSTGELSLKLTFAKSLGPSFLTMML